MSEDPAALDEAERLDAALNRRRIGASLDGLPPALRALVDLAVEVGDACACAGLSGEERERIYAAALEGLDAVQRGLLGWRRFSGRRAALLGGAAAVTAVAAALGVRALAVRRAQRVGLATA